MPTYMDVLPDTGPQPGCIYPQLPTVAPKMCRQHNQPLDLFCHEDKENVCALCGQHGHKGHQVVKLGDERRQRQEELVHMQQEVQRRVQQTERTLKELPHKARQHKALVQALQTENTDLFSDLVKTVNVTGNQIGELLDAHEASLGSQVEGNIQRLEQEVAQLHWRSEELSRLADMQDNIFFLKNFFMVEPLGAAEGSGMGQQEAAVVASIRSVMKSLYSSIENQCNDSVAKIQGLMKDGATAAAANGNPTMTDADETCQTSKQSTVYETVLPATDPVALTFPHASAPPLPPSRPQATPVTSVELAYPEPKTREEMLKFRFFPTMDANTAYRHVLLSDGGHKATLRAENLNYPDHPERFQFWRQLLCSEPLGGSPYYWEVEWTGHKVTVGVAYKEMDRKSSDDKSRLGHNPSSWSLYWSGSGFSFWHDNQDKLVGSPKAKRIGVYLDQHAGTLSFYRVNKNQADLIYRHQAEFTGPLYPGFRFWTGAGATITICDLD